MTDPIDRTHRLADRRFGRANPERLHIVVRRDPVTRFVVWRGVTRLREFTEHRPAMVWARWFAESDARALAPRLASTPAPDEPSVNTFPEPMEAP